MRLSKGPKGIKAYMFLVLIFIWSCFTMAGEVHFLKKKIKLGKESVLAEVADTDEKRSQGLMYRKSLNEGEGMIFIFEDAQVRSFWMKNTFVPLSIGFFNENLELISISDMKPAESLMQNHFETYSSKGPAKYALEVPQGWFKRKKIKLGSRLTIPKD